MNKEKLSQMQGKRVKIRPIARQLDANEDDLGQIDEIWPITKASREQITLFSDRSGQFVELRTDHIREFVTDIDIFTRSDGFLMLKVRILLFWGGGYTIEPFPIPPMVL